MVSSQSLGSEVAFNRDESLLFTSNARTPGLWCLQGPTALEYAMQHGNDAILALLAKDYAQRFVELRFLLKEALSDQVVPKEIWEKIIGDSVKKW